MENVVMAPQIGGPLGFSFLGQGASHHSDSIIGWTMSFILVVWAIIALWHGSAWVLRFAFVTPMKKHVQRVEAQDRKMRKRTRAHYMRKHKSMKDELATQIIDATCGIANTCRKEGLRATVCKNTIDHEGVDEYYDQKY